MRVALVAALAAVLSGCALTWSEATSARRIGPARYLISVATNAYNSPGDAYSFFVRSALYACSQDGFRSFDVIDRSAGTTYGVATLSGRSQLVSREHAEGMVQCTSPIGARSGPPGAAH